MASRYPKDHGISPHRLPEDEPLGSAWLERHAIEHGQLVALLREPSEPVARALLEAYPVLAGVVEVK